MKIKHRIQFQHLQKSELTYEVKVRGEIPEDTCVKLRKQMSILRRTQPPAAVKVSNYSFEEDYKGIRKTLKTIQKNINIIKRCYIMRVAAQTLAMINHLYYRVQRWMNRQNNPENRSSIKKIRKESKRLMRRFSTVSDPRLQGGSSVREMDEAMTISDEDSIDRTISRVIEESYNMYNSNSDGESNVEDIDEIIAITDSNSEGGSRIRVVEERSS